MAVPRSSGSEPVSVAITRHVKTDMVEAFEAWIDEVEAAAAEFDGYAGMDVVRPTDSARPTYVVILRFASHQLYAAWHDSPERTEAVERSLDMTTGAPAFQEAHGLEAWFTLEADSTTTRPARYKTTLITIVGLYPLIVGIGAVVTAVTGLPVALGTLITVTIVSAVATYAVMPWVTRLFRSWLFPDS